MKDRNPNVAAIFNSRVEGEEWADLFPNCTAQATGGGWYVKEIDGEAFLRIDGTLRVENIKVPL